MSRSRFSGPQWLSVLLVFFGVGWVVYLLAASLNTLGTFWPENGWALFFASGLVAAGMAMNGVLFYLFLVADRQQEAPLKFGRVLALHFVGQLLRYLPGRVWGVVYQAGALHGEVSKARLARANIDLMLYSIAGSAVVASVVVMVNIDLPSWIPLAMALGGAGLVGGLLMGAGGLLFRALGQLLPGKLQQVFVEIADCAVSARTLMVASGVFLCSWIAYLWGWHLLGLVYPDYAQVDFITLGALYSIASIIGILAALTPAGLGVREASFIILASGIAPAEVVAYFALFGRIWLLVIELFLCVLPWVVLVMKREK